MADIITNGRPETPEVIIQGGVPVNIGDISIGAVALRDDDTDVRAKIAAGYTVGENDYALAVKDPAVGTTADPESSVGDGSIIALLKSLRTQIGLLQQALAGGLPAALGGNSGLKVAIVDGPVSISASALPTGAATVEKQDEKITVMTSIDSKTPELEGGRVPASVAGTVTSDQGAPGLSAWKVDGSAVTQPVSASSLPLPTGASTSTKQDTGNTSLASIDGKLPALSGGKVPVEVAGTLSVDQGTAGLSAWKVDGSSVTQPVSAVSLPLPTGASTASGQTTGNNSLASIDSKTPTLTSGRVPVDGSGVTQPVSGTVAVSGVGGSVTVTGTVNATSTATEASPAFVRFPRYDMTPFGAVRVAHDFLAFEKHHLYPGSITGYDPEVYGFETSGGGTCTHVPAQSAMRLAIGNSTNGTKARLRTHDFVRYQLGAATHIKQSFYVGDTPATTTMRLVVRSSVSGSVVETPVVQSNWNINTYPGLNPLYGNLYEIKVEWLGVGAVEWYVNGTCVHISSHPNTFAGPYMRTAILPLSMEILNVGGARVARVGLFDDNDGVFWEIQTNAAPAGGGALTVICNSARILNGEPYPTHDYGFTQVAPTSSNTNIVPIFSIRPKALINAIASRAMILPASVTFFSENGAGALEIIANPTLTGATWAATSPSDAVELDTAATAQASGTTLWRTGLAANDGHEFSLKDLFTIAGRKLRLQAFTGTADVLTFAYQRETNTNIIARATVVWQEVR